MQSKNITCQTQLKLCQQAFKYLEICLHILIGCVKSFPKITWHILTFNRLSGSVADPDPNPDPDPVGSSLFFIFDLRCHKMFRFGIKMPYKIIYVDKHQKHIWVGSGYGSGSGQIWSV